MTAEAGAPTPAAVAVRFQAPLLPDLDDVGRYYRLAEERRWYSNDGPCLQLLEERLAAYLGPGVHCLGVCNATIALMVALKDAAAERPGRTAVVLPSWTFVATAAAVAWAGLRPVFVDVDPDAWVPDADAVEDVLATRDDVAAVLGCSTFGTAPPLAVRRRWEDAAAAAGAALVVDSAAGLGAVDEDGRRIGGQGDVEVFSLHATKPFAVGEGGLLVTEDPRLRARLGQWVNFGFDERRQPVLPGLNAKMSEMAAATGLAVLDRFEDVLTHRRGLAAQVRAALEPAGFTSQVGAAGSAVQFVPVLAPDAAARTAVLDAATRAGIEIRTYYDEPLHRTPVYGDAEVHGVLSTSEDLALRTLSLPMANDADDHLVERVVAVCLRALSS